MKKKINKAIIKRDQNSFLYQTTSCLQTNKLIKKWGDELKQLLTVDEKNDLLDLIGRAVMVIHEEQEYCKTFIKEVAEYSNMEFLEITQNEIAQLPKIVANLKKNSIIYIPPGDWSKANSNNEESSEWRSFRHNFAKEIRSEINNKNIAIIVTSGTHYAELDTSLRKIGAFDRRFVLSNPTAEERGLIFLKILGTELCDQSITSELGKVGKLIELNFNDIRRQELIGLAMRRRAFTENRKLSFNDLVFYAVYGGEESSFDDVIDEEHLKRVAIHEAGHALIAMIDSDGKNIPDFANILSKGETGGVVTDSYAYHYKKNGQKTYRDLLHKIRIMLAGRAAEDFIYGAEYVNAWSARSDLINASSYAKEMIGICGLSASPNDVYNLLVMNDDEQSAPEIEYVLQQSRILLTKEYELVKSMISDNFEMLNMISCELLKNKVIYREDLLKIKNQFIFKEAA